MPGPGPDLARGLAQAWPRPGPRVVDFLHARCTPSAVSDVFAHTPGTLRSLGEVIKTDWQSRNLVPAGYELTVCPPSVFNLVGVLFHSEWSQTSTLELSAYWDDRGNAVGLAVGSHGLGDFSYVRSVESDEDLSRLGFRIALVPASVRGR